MGLFNRKNVEAAPGVDEPVTSTSTVSKTDKTGTRSSRGGAGGLASKALRIAQLLLAVLILGLVGYALHVYSITFLKSAYVPAIVAAVSTILATLPLVFLSRLPGVFGHPLSICLVDLFFALFWLATMAELAAYSDVTAPSDVTYYTGSNYGQTDAAYARYAGTINRLKRAWACGAAAAALAGLEFILFLVGALLPLRRRLAGPVAGNDSVGVPTNHHGSVGHGASEPPFEMQTRNTGPSYTGPTSPTRPARDGDLVHGTSDTEGHVLGSGNTVEAAPLAGRYEAAVGTGRGGGGQNMI